MARRRYYFSQKLARRARNMRLFLAALCMIILASVGSSFFEGSARASATSSQSPPLSVSDPCPLLESIRQNPDFAADRIQCPAGNHPDLVASDPIAVSPSAVSKKYH